jgi:hypothetical protein
MNFIYDLVDIPELVGYTQTFFREIAENQFSLRRWFPTVAQDDLAYKINQGALTDVDAAEYRAFDTPAPMSGRQGFARVTGELAPLARQFPVGEEESLRLRAMDTGNMAPLVRAIYADVDRAMRSIAARLALAQGDLLVDGIVTIAENKLQLTADFNMPAGHKVTAPIPWTIANAATAKPITDLLNWQDVLAADSQAADVFLMPRGKLGALQVNAEVRAYAQSGAFVPTRVSLGDINGVLGDQGLPRIELFDEKARVNKVQTRLLPATHGFLLPEPGSTPIGETRMGITAEAVNLIERGLIAREDGSGAIALIMQNAHPVQTFTVGTAIGLPILADPNSHISANLG